MAAAVGSARNGLPWLVLVVSIFGHACDSAPRLPTTPSAAPSFLAPQPPTSPVAQSVYTVFVPVPGAPPVSSDDRLVGRYDLEIEARARSGSTCESVPESATRRTYTADVQGVSGQYLVRLFDAFFLADRQRLGYGCLGFPLPPEGDEPCNQFALTGNADSLSITMRAEDEWRDNEIWEALPDGFLLAVTGMATGQAHGGRIEATGTGSLWYGNGLPASRFYFCESDDLRLTFTPR